ncbi:MAG: hypothetical protein ACK5ND_07150 [Bacteroides sp.]
MTEAQYTQINGKASVFSAFYGYDPHGNITALKRFGRINDSYKAIDDLTLSYKGNQLVKVDDYTPLYKISELTNFKDGVNEATEYIYDQNGNLTKDFNKGINIISYNSLDLLISLSISNSFDSALNNYTYSADGRKLKVEMKYGVNRANIKTADHVGNMIYENGSLKRILVDGGYIENDKYYYYIQDHLGNNRVVAQAERTGMKLTTEK